MSLNARIKDIVDRKEGGNVSAAARRLGYSVSALRKICRGETRSPGGDLLGAIVREYGVDATWLLLGEQADTADVERARIREKAVELIRQMAADLGKG